MEVERGGDVGWQTEGRGAMVGGRTWPGRTDRRGFSGLSRLKLPWVLPGRQAGMR